MGPKKSPAPRFQTPFLGGCILCYSSSRLIWSRGRPLVCILLGADLTLKTQQEACLSGKAAQVPVAEAVDSHFLHKLRLKAQIKITFKLFEKACDATLSSYDIDKQHAHPLKWSGDIIDALSLVSCGKQE